MRNLSLTVPGGQTVALVGRSGAGKSTIINLVARLFDVSAGRILIDGQDIRDVTLASLRDAVAMVSQEITLFDDTIRANIALGRLGASEEEIVAAARAAAAHDFIMAQPDGYDTVIGEGGLRLSGGQRQRLALARAILKNAPILLLDEATSALDTESESLVQAALARFTRNRTTLVIAHRLSTVQRASMICLMDEGRLAEVGTHAELLARNGIYARLCRSQALLIWRRHPRHASAAPWRRRPRPPDRCTIEARPTHRILVDNADRPVRQERALREERSGAPGKNGERRAKAQAHLHRDRRSCSRATSASWGRRRVKPRR